MDWLFLNIEVVVDIVTKVIAVAAAVARRDGTVWDEEDLQEDLEENLKTISDLGYDGIELGDFQKRISHISQYDPATRSEQDKNLLSSLGYSFLEIAYIQSRGSEC